MRFTCRITPGAVIPSKACTRGKQRFRNASFSSILLRRAALSKIIVFSAWPFQTPTLADGGLTLSALKICPKSPGTRGKGLSVHTICTYVRIYTWYMILLNNMRTRIKASQERYIKTYVLVRVYYSISLYTLSGAKMLGGRGLIPWVIAYIH